MKLMNKVYTSRNIPQVIYPGQLWFDETINKLKIHDGSSFIGLDFFDYDISVPNDINISNSSGQVVLQPKQRAYLNFTSNTVDLTKVKFVNNGDELYFLSLSIFDEATIYSIELDHGFGSSTVAITQYSAADMARTTYLYNGDIAFRDHKHSKFEKNSQTKDKFVILPSSSSLQSPLTCDIYILYRGFNERRSIHYSLYGFGNFIIGSAQALSNGNAWQSIGKININADSPVSGYILIYRLL